MKLHMYEQQIVAKLTMKLHMYEQQIVAKLTAV